MTRAWRTVNVVCVLFATFEVALIWNVARPWLLGLAS